MTATAAEEPLAHATPTRLWHVIFIAVVAIVFTALWLAVYGLLSGALWPANYFTVRRWTIPVGVLVFSLIVGLAQKYLRAPLTAILLVAVVGTADPNEIALLVLSSIVALIVGGAVQGFLARRAKSQTKSDDRPAPASTAAKAPPAPHGTEAPA